MAAMDLSTISEVLKATQLSDPEARKQAEATLDGAAAGAPNQLVRALVGVLTATEVADDLRLEAAVIVRQLVLGLANRASVWQKLEADTLDFLKAQTLERIGAEASDKVRRGVGQIVVQITFKLMSGMADMDADGSGYDSSYFENLQKAWPQFLPAIAQLSAPACPVPVRVVALEVLRDQHAGVLVGFLEPGNRNELASMLATMLGDQAAEIRVAGVQLALAMIRQIFVKDLTEPAEGETVAPLVQAMTSVLAVIQGLANRAQEEQLCQVLEDLVVAARESAEFFKDSQSFQPLCETVVKIASSGSEAFDDDSVRHNAMEVLVVFAEKLAEDIAQPEGLPFLETLLSLNLQWMTEVEEDADVWTLEGKDTDEDDCDSETNGLGEENIDRIAERFAELAVEESEDIDAVTSDKERVYMTAVWKVIRAAMAQPGANWKQTRASIMVLSQSIEHITDEDQIDQVMKFIVPQLTSTHPRVRYAAFWGIAQACYDQSDYVPDKFGEGLVEVMIAGMEDPNVRVVIQAVSAFTSLGEELDDEIEPFQDELLKRLFRHLYAGDSQELQEQCLSAIAVVAKATQMHFLPHYSTVMPMLKQVVGACTTERQRTLQGKAFMCIALIGSVVGKELFLTDARETLAIMIPLAQVGLGADDPRRAVFREALGKVAMTIGQDVHPYVGGLLPGLFETLAQKPMEMDPDFDEDDSDDEEGVDLLSMRNTVLQEMEEALVVMQTLIEACEEKFCEFMPATCQSLLTLFDKPLSQGLFEQLYATWESLAGCAQVAVVEGKLDASILRELVSEFLKKTVGALVKIGQASGAAGSLGDREATLMSLQAAGAAGVLKQAGDGAVSAECVKEMTSVIIQLLNAIPSGKEDPADPGLFRRRGSPPEPEDDADVDEDDEDVKKKRATSQSVRFSLCSVVSALASVNRDAFVEFALPSFMELVKTLVRPAGKEGVRALGFYIADDLVTALGEKTVPYWNGFMNEALLAVHDSSPIVRQFAVGVIGHASPQAIFAQMAPAAATQVVEVLYKLGEKHRRRRAVKLEAVQGALAMDACIAALGQICANQEQTLGANAATAWSLWLTHLPIKYNVDAGKAAHELLIELLMKNHAVVSASSNWPAVLKILSDVYESEFTTSELDAKIVTAVTSLDSATLEGLCNGFSEKQKKKVKFILSNGEKSAVGGA